MKEAPVYLKVDVMKPLLCTLLLFTLLPQSFCSAAAQPNPLDELKASYDKSIQIIDVAYQAERKKLNDIYNKHLIKLVEQARADGDLDLLIKMKEEEKRFLNEQSVPSPPPSDLNPQLAKVQAGYNKAVSGLNDDKARGVLTPLSQHIKRLEGLKQAYVKKGAIEDAIDVKAVLDGAKEEYRLVRATIGASVVNRPHASTKSRLLPDTLGNELPDPDGKPADMSKPVKVFILLGQSNMLGFGKVAGDKAGTLENATKSENLYPFLVDDAGNWTERKDVRNVRIMGSGTGAMTTYNNEWMTIKGRNIGPEIGIGHHVGNLLDEPVMILKSCIGNRSLSWDLLPPGSPAFEFEDKGKIWHYAGYRESPERWEKGREPKPIGWYAGMQYDGDIARAKKTLAELGTYYPEATKFDVAGFFFWQGDKDRRNAGHASRYEQNLVQLIKQLRKDFNAPKAKFVCATLGQTSKGSEGTEGLILNAQLAVDGETGKYKEFKGNVATVYSKPLCQGGSSNGHYSGNAKTYMDIGLAMGEAMTNLLKNP
jgi:hypothetical protein